MRMPKSTAWGILLSLCTVTAVPGQSQGAADDAGALMARARHQQAFLTAHPGAALAERGGRVIRVYGKAFSEGKSAQESAEAFRLAHSGVLGVPANDLEPTGPFFDGRHVQPIMYLPETGEYKFQGVYYRQVRDGVPVHGSWLKLLVRNEKGFPMVLASSSLRDLGGFHVDAAQVGGALPGASAQAAIARAVQVSMDPGLPQVTGSAQVIFAGADDVAVAPRLADEVEVAIGVDRWSFVVHAATGSILHEEPRVHTIDIVGTVNGNATEGDGADTCGAEVPTPMPYLRVVAGANSAFAAADGSFTIPNPGTAPILVSAGTDGLWFDVFNIAGAQMSVSQTVTPPGPATLLLNAANTDGQVRAQVNGYVGANVVRDAAIAANPVYPTLNIGNFPVNVNRTDGFCPNNAWYDGSSINFCLPGSSNTAFASVIYHEYGHHLVAAGGSGQGQYGEGMGDVFSVILLDNPLLGIGFSGSCASGIRSAVNGLTYPCAGEIHFCGQLISGCVWEVRNELVVTEPADYTDILMSLAVNSILVHSGSLIEPQITLDWLTLDDDDLDLCNGTPHFAEIATGFDEHGMLADSVDFTFPDGLPLVINPAGGTTVAVGVSCVSVPPLPDTGELHVDSGSGFVSIPMDEIATNSYEAVFPAVPCGTGVSYYFSVETPSGEQTEPAGAPASSFTAFSASTVSTPFSDDFQTDQGWTIATTALDGPWQRAVPIPTSICDRGNPGADGDGSGICYVTDNSSADACNSDVDNGATTLTSPLLDASAEGDVYVSYWRWYSNTFGAAPNQDTMLVEVSGNGGGSWTTLEIVGPVNEANGGWFNQSFRVADFVTPSNQFRIRFTASDTDPQSVVEAGIDGVTLTLIECGAECPWDCQSVPDGAVGINDLLALLAQWGLPTDCDFDGGGVGINDLLAMLAVWGACP